MIPKLRKSRSAGFWHGVAFASFAGFSATNWIGGNFDESVVLGVFAIGVFAAHIYFNRFASDAIWLEAFDD